MSASELSVLSEKVNLIGCAEGYEGLVEYVHSTYGIDQYKAGVTALKILTNQYTKDDMVRLIKEN